MRHSLNWTDKQLLNSAISMLATESEYGAKRSRCWDEKDGDTANVAQKCHCSLRKGCRKSCLQCCTQHNLSMGQKKCSKHGDTFPRLIENKNINTNRQQ